MSIFKSDQDITWQLDYLAKKWRKADADNAERLYLQVT